MYILYMQVHTHIFIISKYEVKHTHEVLYYITESMSVRQENEKNNFCYKCGRFPFGGFLHEIGFSLSKFITLNDRV